MKIAIIGTRGIPNNYGGFEQFVEYLSVGLVKLGHEVTVYNSSDHVYRDPQYHGVTILRKWNPEKNIGAASHFIYDFLCLKNALKQNFDIIYEAGYATNVPSHLLLNIRKSIIVTNMDGLEWKRSKWNFFTRKLTKFFEKLAVKTSHHLIADNEGIQQYLLKEYNVQSHFLAYGANVVNNFSKEDLNKYGLEAYKYFLVVARLEPENNIEMMVEGYLNSQSGYPLIVIGNTNTKFYKKFAGSNKAQNVHFVGGVYNKDVLDSLRKYSLAYLHGHSVGGTNPSLLEAMGSHAFIISHNNPFNAGVLKENALYFSNAQELANVLTDIDYHRKDKYDNFIQNNLHVIRTTYSWERIIELHVDFFEKIIFEKDKKRLYEQPYYKGG